MASSLARFRSTVHSTVGETWLGIASRPEFSGLHLPGSGSVLAEAFIRNCVPVTWAWGAHSVTLLAPKVRSGLWYGSSSFAKDEGLWGFDGPYWLWLWPGSWALCSVVAADPARFCRSDLLIDLGCGCGAVGILARKLGAPQVVFNDICPISLAATAINCALNDIEVGSDSHCHLEGRNLLVQSGTSEGGRLANSDERSRVSVLAGDMLYDRASSQALAEWGEALCEGHSSEGLGRGAQGWQRHLSRAVDVDIVCASPDWPATVSLSPKTRGWRLQSKVELPWDVALVCHGLSACSVWEVR
jgi:predicted nicotinamide N-methyase